MKDDAGLDPIGANDLFAGREKPGLCAVLNAGPIIVPFNHAFVGKNGRVFHVPHAAMVRALSHPLGLPTHFPHHTIVSSILAHPHIKADLKTAALDHDRFGIGQRGPMVFSEKCR
jgi:hypothetical protein